MEIMRFAWKTCTYFEDTKLIDSSRFHCFICETFDALNTCVTAYATAVKNHLTDVPRAQITVPGSCRPPLPRLPLHLPALRA